MAALLTAGAGGRVGVGVGGRAWAPALAVCLGWCGDANGGGSGCALQRQSRPLCWSAGEQHLGGGRNE